jgi:hypothetical protein
LELRLRIRATDSWPQKNGHGRTQRNTPQANTEKQATDEHRKTQMKRREEKKT